MIYSKKKQIKSMLYYYENLKVCNTNNRLANFF